MVKSNGGKKTKTFKKKGVTTSIISEITPDNTNTFAGVVERPLGCCKFLVRTSEGLTYVSLLPGSLRKGPRISRDQMLLIQIEPSLSKKNAYILHLYDDSELHNLNINKLLATNNNEVVEEDVVFRDTEIDDV